MERVNSTGETGSNATMTKDLIRYDILAQQALRGMVKRVLADTARAGLPGDHHFFINFDTTAPGVRMSQRLREQHPEEMTVVLQHQFWDLKADDENFEVTLSFNGVAENLRVPFASIKGFFDPSVSFGLQFDPANATGDTDGEAPEAADAATPTPVAAEPADDQDRQAEPAEADGEKIVSLDNFRRK